MIASSAWVDFTPEEGEYWDFGGGRQQQRITGVQWYTDWEIADGGSASKIRTVRGDDGIYMFYQKSNNKDFFRSTISQINTSAAEMYFLRLQTSYKTES